MHRSVLKPLRGPSRKEPVYICLPIKGKSLPFQEAEVGTGTLLETQEHEGDCVNAHLEETAKKGRHP